ncbi:hypothetical protein ACFYVL_42910 [Streptomyces sp. NPDC004111]|uniref:hypothetical protein n=1 Tax=Streptomyces sp. NPDC004111 TaxID=3364690 RepID=UPI0036BEA0F0
MSQGPSLTQEAWPTCPDHDGPWQLGIRPEDIRLRRRILTEAWERPGAAGADLLSTEERETLDRIGKSSRIPLEGPLPMVPVAQLHAADVPDLLCPDGTDLLQVLWCPFGHGEDELPRTELRWRTTATLTGPYTPAPWLPVIGNDDYLPEPCVLHPETVTEYPAPHELPEELAERIEAWGDQHEFFYQYDLAVAPGCKTGGHAPWSFRDPFPMACPTCGSNVRPLLTLDGCEWDGGSVSWRPLEDAHDAGEYFRGPANPTQLTFGRGYSLQLHVCTASSDHPHLQSVQ